MGEARRIVGRIPWDFLAGWAAAMGMASALRHAHRVLIYPRSSWTRGDHLISAMGKYGRGGQLAIANLTANVPVLE
jgi:hypothetical protein